MKRYRCIRRCHWNGRLWNPDSSDPKDSTYEGPLDPPHHFKEVDQNERNAAQVEVATLSEAQILSMPKTKIIHYFDKHYGIKLEAGQDLRQVQTQALEIIRNKDIKRRTMSEIIPPEDGKVIPEKPAKKDEKER